MYSESSGHPDTLLTIGSSTTLRAAAWNTVPVTPFSLVAGTRYWFALLATGGNIKFRQRYGTGGGIDELHAQQSMTSLPSTWITGTIYAGGAWTSAYGSGVVTGTQTAASPVLAVNPNGLNFGA
ncbi:MAG TPA: hypothetical protein VN868_06375 [Terriglobales bacterium]|nr:hypothetical protein [Terriglobales bacterium]